LGERFYITAVLAVHESHQASDMTADVRPASREDSTPLSCGTAARTPDTVMH